MHVWKTAALTAVSLAAFAAGAWSTGTVRAQDRDRAPLARAFQFAGRGAQIGVTVRDVDGDAAKQASGVIVDEVKRGSPAETAGIKAGDAIVEFDGERVRSVRQFTRLVRETASGRQVPAVLTRNGARVTVSIAPERSSAGGFDLDEWADGMSAWAYQLPPAPPAPARPPDAPRPPRAPDFDFNLFGRGGRLGISVESLTPQLSEYFGAKDGVLVRSVTDGSAAAKAGLKAGDVITSVNGSAVNDPSDVTRAINHLDENDDFTLEIVRDRKTQSLKGKLEPRQDRARSRTRTIV